MSHQYRQTVDDLEYCTASTSKHGLWLSHADGRLSDLDGKVQLLHHQSMQLSLTGQNLVTRVEVDVLLSSFLNVSKGQWKSNSDAVDERLLSAERMQARVAKDIAKRCQNLERFLGVAQQQQHEDDNDGLESAAAAAYYDGGVGGRGRQQPELANSSFAKAMIAKVETTVLLRVAEAAKASREEMVQMLLLQNSNNSNNNNGGNSRQQRQDEEERENTKREMQAMREELGAAIRQAKKAADDGHEELRKAVEGHSRTIAGLVSGSTTEKVRLLDAKLSDALSDVSSLKAEVAALQFDLKSLAEEVDGDRARNKAQGKTIGGGMVELKKSVEGLEAALAERDRETERTSKRAGGDLQTLKDKVAGLERELGTTDAAFAKKFQAEFDSAAGRLAEENKVDKSTVTKILSEIAKINLEMNKLETGLLKEENERKDGAEEVSLELGVLKIKVDEVSGSFGSVGGRILIVEEQVKAVAAAQKEAWRAVAAAGGVGGASMTTAATVTTAAAEKKQLQVVGAASSNDSFESDEHDAVNTQREKRAVSGLAQLSQLKSGGAGVGGGVGGGVGVGAGASIAKGPPVKVAAAAPASKVDEEEEDDEDVEEDLDESYAAADDDEEEEEEEAEEGEEEEEGEEDDEDDDDDDSFEAEPDSRPTRGRISNEECDAVEEVEKPVAVATAPAAGGKKVSPKKASPKKVASGGAPSSVTNAATKAGVGGLPASSAAVFERQRSGSLTLGVPPAEAAQIPPKAGERVKARWRGGRSWFKGVCLGVNDKNAEGGGGQVTFHVQYDDMSFEKFVRKDYIVLDEEAIAAVAAAAAAVAAAAAPATKTAAAAAAAKAPAGPPARDQSAAERDKAEEEKQLADSTQLRFPSQIFVRRWRPEHVRDWLLKHVRLPDVAQKFYDKKMSGEMLMDKNWTSADMELDLSHPTNGMGIVNAQFRARVSAFIKALRERDIEARNMRIRNYYLIWGEEDNIRDEPEEEDDA